MSPRSIGPGGFIASVSTGGSDQNNLNLVIIDKLQSELDALRRSTKQALEQSWEEAETLQTRLVKEKSRGDVLAKELDECREREQLWKSKCDELLLVRMDGGSLSVVGTNDHDEQSCPLCSCSCSKKSNGDDAPVRQDDNNDALLPTGEAARPKKRNGVLRSALSVFGGVGGIGNGNGSNNGGHRRRHSESSTPPHRKSSGSGGGAAAAAAAAGDCRNVEMLKSFKVSCEDWDKFLSNEEYAEEELAEMNESWPSVEKFRHHRKNYHGEQGRSSTKAKQNEPWPPSSSAVQAFSALLESSSTTASSTIVENGNLQGVVAATELDIARSAAFRDRESSLLKGRVDLLEREVRRWKKKARELDAVVVRQVEWSEDCQGYIRELTDELSRMYDKEEERGNDDDDDGDDEEEQEEQRRNEEKNEEVVPA